MATPDLSLSQVNSLPQVHVSEFTQLEWALEQAQIHYGKAAEMEREAWAMFYEGIDAGYTDAAVTQLREHATLAETLRVQAYRELDAAKAMILALQS